MCLCDVFTCLLPMLVLWELECGGQGQVRLGSFDGRLVRSSRP
jgi:hypothetical protein